jgi:hypothetical protein
LSPGYFSGNPFFFSFPGYNEASRQSCPAQHLQDEAGKTKQQLQVSIKHTSILEEMILSILDLFSFFGKTMKSPDLPKQPNQPNINPPVNVDMWNINHKSR